MRLISGCPKHLSKSGNELSESKTISKRPKTPENPNGAGRKKGGKNKDKKGLIDRMQRLAFDLWGIEEWTPFDYAAKIASAPTPYVPVVGPDGETVIDGDGKNVMEAIDPAFKLQCAKFVADFTYPKLKSIELSPANSGSRFKVKLRVNVEGKKVMLTPEQEAAVDALDNE